MRLRAALVAAFYALLIVGASADERITSYNSNIDVAKNGALTVTETISVIAEGDRIRHGIYRDFPTTYTDKLGRRVHVSFDLLHVTRDGSDEPYSLDSIESGVRIKIGSADILVPEGRHTYTITYATDRQIGFFRDYDELYWNVTGNFWIFPIDRADATINLPMGAHIRQYASYTGSAGSRANNAQCEQFSGRTLHCWTTAVLEANEGLTVAVGFDKGAVLPPTGAEQRAMFIRDNASSVAAALGVAILLIYFLVTWFEFGRDPPGGPVIPLFAPPKDFSPAAVRFVHEMGYDRKAFAATLIDMAVKGYMKIAQDDGTYKLTRTGKLDREAGLASAESAVSDKLFSSPHDSIELKQTNHTDVAAAISALKTSLKNEYEKAYFVTNSHWFIGGLVILAVTGIAVALLSDDAATAGFMLFWLGGWSVGTSFLVHRVYDNWHDVIFGPGSRILNTISAVFITAFATPFVGALIFVLYTFGGQISWMASAALVAGGIAAYVFYHLLKAPTLLGSKIRAQIDGFRMYLSTAETPRLEMLHPPAVTPEVFEKFLPYAIALDCENAWSKKFEAEAAAAGTTPDQGYTPVWYSGGSYGSFSPSSFASSIGASMAAAAASAATAPGSSSGSGGGGSSGGGGGGGGGGGW